MSKKVTFFISDNVGEIDIIFPIVLDLQKKNYITNILITNQKIYDDFQKLYMEHTDNNILSKIKKLNFLFNEKIEKNMPRKIYKFLNIIFNLKIIFKFLNSSNVYFIENSFRTSFGRFLLKINNIIYKKTIICYPHGLRPFINFEPYNNLSNKNIKFKVYHLSFTNSHEENEIISKAGYTDNVPIGYPLKSDYWESMKTKLRKKSKKQFLLLPRHLHQEWLNEEDAKKLVLNISNSMQKYFSNYTLVIKIHPKDKTIFFQQLIDTFKIKNVVVSYDNIAYEIVNSSLVICNLTSSIYMSYALNIPSIEIYTDRNAIKKWFPLSNGLSPYEYVGFKSINSFDEIENYFKKLDLGNFKFNLNISLNNLDSSKLEKTISE